MAVCDADDARNENKDCSVIAWSRMWLTWPTIIIIIVVGKQERYRRKCGECMSYSCVYTLYAKGPKRRNNLMHIMVCVLLDQSGCFSSSSIDHLACHQPTKETYALTALILASFAKKTTIYVSPFFFPVCARKRSFANIQSEIQTFQMIRRTQKQSQQQQRRRRRKKKTDNSECNISEHGIDRTSH